MARSCPDSITARESAYCAVTSASREYQSAYTRLQQLTASLPDHRHLVHGHLLRNMLVRGPQITAVFDWANALYGDWLYDAAWLIFCWPWFPRLHDIDITSGLRQHRDRHGITPPGLQPRLQACLLHIGLGAIAYNAYRQSWDDLTLSTRQTSHALSPPPTTITKASQAAHAGIATKDRWQSAPLPGSCTSHTSCAEARPQRAAGDQDREPGHAIGRKLADGPSSGP
jgi:Phosphotransferase enzyme family